MGKTISKEHCDAFDADCNLEHICYKQVQVETNGCRQFPPLPPPGEHPRLFFTKHEIPQLRARIKSKLVWDKLYKVMDATMKVYRAYVKRVDVLSEEERACPTEVTIREFFKVDETRNTGLLGALCWGFIKEDVELMDKVKDIVVFYSRVVRASCEFARSNEVMEKPFNFWHSKDWDVTSPWLVGGCSFAILYDLLFNDMNEDERAVVRGSLADSCQGRISWGFDWPARRIQSNWAPYNSQLYVMLSAIEEEEGFDDRAHWKFENLLMQYMDHAFHESGHPMEDGYALNLGFREGSYSLIAMARRGLNIFNHPRYLKCMKSWLPFALEPGHSGEIYGGSSGSLMMYPTSIIIAKYAFPKDQVIDYVYRKYISERSDKTYSRLTKFQSRLPVLLFSMPALNDELCIKKQGAALSLPLTFNCPNRGKMVMRSDWSSEALWFTLDARPDAFLIGHDSPSRGNFVFHALGRAWAVCPEWNTFQEGHHYSIPTIDGTSQKAKATSVHPLGITQVGDIASCASAVLTYAYNWTWTQWAKEGANPGADWEPEPSNPRDFGMNTWWLPHKLMGERRVAFAGLHQWRRRIREVELVTRSTLLVRSANPYVIIADSVRVDGEEHTLTWQVVMPTDMVLESCDGMDAIVAEDGESGGRRLLVHSIGVEGTYKMEMFASKDRSGNESKFNRLTFEVIAFDVDFRFLLYPLENAEIGLPECQYSEADKQIVVNGVDNESCETIVFGSGEHGEITMQCV